MSASSRRHDEHLHDQLMRFKHLGGWFQIGVVLLHANDSPERCAIIGAHSELLTDRWSEDDIKLQGAAKSTLVFWQQLA